MTSASEEIGTIEVTHEQPVTITFGITREVVADIFTTFLDASTHSGWTQFPCAIEVGGWPEGAEFLGEVPAYGGTVRMFTLAVGDIGEVKDEQVDVDLAYILRGMHTAMNSGKPGLIRAATNFLTGDGDFTDADVIVQLGAFGEVIFG